MQKILFYGGSFDPPHRVHRGLLEAALALVQPDTALIVPTGNASSYKKRPLSPAQQRIAMCQLAFGDLPGVQISDVEAYSQQPSYTIESLEAIERSLGQGVDWYLLLGSDQFAAIRSWHRWPELLAKVNLVLAQRADAPPVALKMPADLAAGAQQNGHNSGFSQSSDLAQAHILPLPWSAQDLSSTAIRQALADSVGQDANKQAWLAQVLGQSVLRYIAAHSLYSQ